MTLNRVVISHCHLMERMLNSPLHYALDLEHVLVLLPCRQLTKWTCCQFDYVPIYGELPEFDLNVGKQTLPTPFVASENPWETIFNYSCY
ncbi:unnamed protein product [Camellia sinensis]